MTKEENITKKWKEHFKQILNQKKYIMGVDCG